MERNEEDRDEQDRSSDKYEQKSSVVLNRDHRKHITQHLTSHRGNDTVNG